MKLLASIVVGDAGDDPPAIEYWIDKLQIEVHRQAERQYGRTRGCAQRAYSRETHGRQAFAAFMTEMNVPNEAFLKHLAEWDACSRPVAIFHWFKPEAPSSRRLS